MRARPAITWQLAGLVTKLLHQQHALRGFVRHCLQMRSCYYFCIYSLVIEKKVLISFFLFVILMVHYSWIVLISS